MLNSHSSDVLYFNGCIVYIILCMNRSRYATVYQGLERLSLTNKVWLRLALWPCGLFHSPTSTNIET